MSARLGLACIIGLGVGLSCVVIDPDAQLCAIGGDGCACTAGGGCDPGLVCVEAICADPDGGTGSGTGTSSASGDPTGAVSSDESSSAETTGGAAGPNIVFVTSTLHGGGSIGGLEGADAICQAQADAAGLAGTYRAWLSDLGTDARDRLAGARGWQRPDGLPFADTLDEALGGHMYYPIVLDANGTEVEVLSPVWTGTIDDGAAGDIEASEFCGGWTNGDASLVALLGTVGGGQFWWTAHFGQTCNLQAHLYCFGIDSDSALVVEPTEGRLAFATIGGFSANAGRPAADALCQAEADAAGRSGSFLALMAMPGEAPAARFELDGAPWVRADGIALFRDGNPMGDTLAAPVSLDAAGNVVPYAMAFSGAPSPTLAGTDVETCGGWTSLAGPSPIATIFHTNWFFWSLDGGMTEECSQPFGLLCFEQ